jgi:hypothetical protein
MSTTCRRLWVVWVAVLIVVFTGCDGKNTSPTSSAPAGTTGNYKVVYEKNEYQLVKKTSEDSEEYIVRIFDNEKKVIIYERSYPVSRLTPSVTMLDNDVFRITLGIGTGLNSTQFYDRKNNRVSPEYSTPLLVDYDKVVAPKRGKLAVSDMFDHNVFYKEITLDDFAPVANPVDAFGEIRWINKTRLSVTYLTGKKGEEYIRKTVIIDLEK